MIIITFKIQREDVDLIFDYGVGMVLITLEHSKVLIMKVFLSKQNLMLIYLGSSHVNAWIKDVMSIMVETNDTVLVLASMKSIQ